jgi:hypothetical protein
LDCIETLLDEAYSVRILDALGNTTQIRSHDGQKLIGKEQ